jgi:hypothetical protein
MVYLLVYLSLYLLIALNQKKDVKEIRSEDKRFSN